MKKRTGGLTKKWYLPDKGKRVGVKRADKAARFVQTKARQRKGTGEGTEEQYQVTFRSSSVTLLDLQCVPRTPNT